MNTFDKELSRAAEILHGQLRGAEDDLELPEEDWRQLQQLVRQIHRAKERQWRLAADRLVTNLACAVIGLRQQLSDFCDALRPSPLTRGVATVTDIYRDLLALRDEFDDVSVDWEEEELCVTTPPIVLDGLRLGPFQIRLSWIRLSRFTSYRVVALEPNPARVNEDVTHPHVDNETLCEGDGRAAIRAALESGRVGDFFLLVSRLLHTYSAGRAYVELSDWHGSPCDQCGASVEDDDRSCCQRCDEMLCANCVCCCAGCHETYCSGCINLCDSCNSELCVRCLDKCVACQCDVCEDCSLEGHCPNCQKEENHDDQTTHPNQGIEAPNIPIAKTSIQPDCLVKTPVPA